jgi:hypothetical protein
MLRRGHDKAGVAGAHSVRFRRKDAVLRLLDSI